MIILFILIMASTPASACNDQKNARKSCLSECVAIATFKKPEPQGWDPDVCKAACESKYPREKR